LRISWPRVLSLAVVASVAWMMLATSAATAAAVFVAPHGRSYNVAVDANGKPAPFTVDVRGLPSQKVVYVEQCDGVAPTDPNWSTTRDCDLGSSPAGAIVSPQGEARFDVADRNHAFHPFVGASPQGLFNCLRPGAASPRNGLPDFHTCQIRVSSSNGQPTADQVFLPITLGGASSGGHGGSLGVVIAVVTIVLMAALLLFIFLSSRRKRAPATR